MTDQELRLGSRPPALAPDRFALLDAISHILIGRTGVDRPAEAVAELVAQGTQAVTVRVLECLDSNKGFRPWLAWPEPVVSSDEALAALAYTANEIMITKQDGQLHRLAVPIPGVPAAWGILEVSSLQEDAFSPEAQTFTRMCANLLGLFMRHQRLAETHEQDESRYRLVLDGSNDGIYDWDIQRGTVYWNDRYYEMLGLQPGELEPSLENFTELVHPEDRERVSAEIQAHLQRPDKYEMSYRIRHKEGHYLHITCRGRTEFGPNGQPVRMGGLVRDITREIQAQQELQESEVRFRTMADSSPILIWVAGKDGEGEYFNQTWLDFTGRTLEEECAGAWVEAIHPEDRMRAITACQQAKVHQRDLSVEFRFRRADGEYRWMLDTAKPRYTLEGEFVGYIGSMVDITDRKQMELALQESETRFREMCDSAPFMVWMTDAQFNSVYRNRMQLEYLGIVDMTPPYPPIFNYVHPDDLEAFRQRVTTAFERRESFQVEFRARRHDGEYRWHMGIGGPRYQADGVFLGFTGAAFDIHDRKQAVQALAESERRLRRMVESDIIGVVFWNKQGAITGANDAILRMLGYTREELEAGLIDWRRMTPPEFAHLDEAAFEEMDVTGSCTPYEKQYIRKDGQRVDILLGVAYLEDTMEEGVAFILDITDRKKAEQSLQQSLERERLNRRILEIISQPKEVHAIMQEVADLVGPFFKADRCVVASYRLHDGLYDVDVAGQYTARPEHAAIRIEDFSSDLLDCISRNLTREAALRLVHAPTPEAYRAYLAEVIRQWPLPDETIFRYEQDLEELIFRRYGVQSTLRVGIGYQGRPYGAITLQQCSAPRAWSDSEISLLQDIANYMGLAMYQDELFRHEQAAREELQQSNDLLDIISSAQNHFISNENIYTLFQEPLERLLEYTRSDYGFIGEVLHKEDGTPYLKCNFLTNVAWDEETRRLYEENRLIGFEFHTLDNLFGYVVRTGEVVIANDPDNDPRRGSGRPPGHPPLRSFMGLPFKKNGRLIGMVGIANRPGGYDETLLDELEPFLTACANIIQGYRNERMRERLNQDLKASEQSLKLYAAKLERSNQELEQFAMVASHDLQAPLRKVLLFSGFLAQALGDNLSPEAREYLTRIQKAVSHMQNLIGDLLALSRVHRRIRPFQQVALDQVMHEVEADLQTAIAEAQGTLVVEKPLPVIQGDPMLLRQLLQNLVDNGMKFHRAGCPPVVTVSGSLSGDGQWCELRVRDNGIGFDEKYLDRIFAVFERLHSDTEYPGTGIGLAICRKIAERHGGSITAQSRPGEGATFIVTLPVRPENDELPSED